MSVLCSIACSMLNWMSLPAQIPPCCWECRNGTTCTARLIAQACQFRLRNARKLLSSVLTSGSYLRCAAGDTSPDLAATECTTSWHILFCVFECVRCNEVSVHLQELLYSCNCTLCQIPALSDKSTDVTNFSAPQHIQQQHLLVHTFSTDSLALAWEHTKAMSLLVISRAIRQRSIMLLSIIAGKLQVLWHLHLLQFIHSTALAGQLSCKSGSRFMSYLATNCRRHALSLSGSYILLFLHTVSEMTQQRNSSYAVCLNSRPE